MLSGLALLGVALAGIYFLGLAALAFIAPRQARRFLLGFAGSAAVHYLELLIRLAVGGAFVLRAPLMMFPQAFSLVGWVLIITSGCRASPARPQGVEEGRVAARLDIQVQDIVLAGDLLADRHRSRKWSASISDAPCNRPAQA